MAFIFKGCQNSNHCRCNLEVINRINSAVKVVVGEDKLIGMRVVVTNSGDEPSHDTVLRIRAPIDLPLPRELECQKAPGGPNQEVQVSRPTNIECLLMALAAPVFFTAFSDLSVPELGTKGHQRGHRLFRHPPMEFAHQLDRL